MTAFLALCLLSRLAYALNDVLVGRLARQHSQLEVAAFRGLALGLTMSPLLAFVPAAAFVAFAERWPIYLMLVTVTGIANVLQNRAARLLPFGLRAALMISAVSIASLALGASVFGERLSATQVTLGLVLVAAAILAASGAHAAHEIRPDIPKGASLALLSGAGLAVAGAFTKTLVTETDPLLTAWAWEFGAGAVLLGPLAWQWRRGWPPGAGARFRRTAIASAPTIVGSGASMVALKLGALGLWGALAGTQVLFTAALGVRWHGEAMGLRRWLSFVAAAAAVSGLALVAR
jgi:drug/metabolite transporter (DMT)-like permease